MALKKCKECGKAVSTKAKICQSCGAPIQQNKGAGCLILIAIIIVFSMIHSAFDDDDKKPSKAKTKTPPPKEWYERDNSITAYLVMEDFVKKRLKSPKTAEFPGCFENRKHTKYLGDQKYRIVSYVDAQNSFGATIRNNFIGEIEQVEKHRWQLISLELFPR